MRRWAAWATFAFLAGCGRNDSSSPEGGASNGDPRREKLMAEKPGDSALGYLSGTVLFTEDETEFLTTMCALSRSASPEVASLAADIASTGYHLAAQSQPDVERAIEVGLNARLPHVRRIVVRNLGQIECPPVRRWLEDRATDDGIGVTDARTVGEEARASLARLDRAREEGLSVSPSDVPAIAVAVVGTRLRAPIPGTVLELAIDIESVTPPEPTGSELPQPQVAGMFTVVPRGEDWRISALHLGSVPIYAGGWLKSADMTMFVWCRPIGRDRVRCWYRVEVSSLGK